MPEFVMDLFEPLVTRDALIVVALPTTGSASSIAAQFLVRQLELPLVGHLRTPELSGLTAIQDGYATSPIRLYGGEVKCRLEKKCPRIYLVTTELALTQLLLARLGEAILEWAKKGGAHLVLVLEGVVRGAGDQTPDVFMAAGDPKVLAELEKTGIPIMGRAIIAGITAQLLLTAPVRGVRAGALIVEASHDHPDARAAAALVEALSRIVPEVAMDPKPLLKEAAQLERELLAAQKASPEMMPTSSSFI